MQSVPHPAYALLLLTVMAATPVQAQNQREIFLEQAELCKLAGDMACYRANMREANNLSTQSPPRQMDDPDFRRRVQAEEERIRAENARREQQRRLREAQRNRSGSGNVQSAQ
ncbi:MAG: hypothetical protein IPK29_14890 [Betaproteobacteria bacterium]|nr:hypothetical protein [Betaproteobacteria bacterium]